MKLRAKLMLLALGSILIPIVVMGMSTYISYRYFQKVRPASPHAIDRIIAHFETELARRAETGAVEPLGDPPAPFSGHELAVIDKEGVVVYSSSSHFTPGRVRSLGPLIGEEGDLRERHLLTIPLVVENEVIGSLLILFPQRPYGDRKGVPFHVRVLERGIFGFMAFVVFASVMVLIIMRSLNRPLKRLMAATRRIAEGDLNFELLPRGKDELASLTKSFDSMRSELKEAQARRSRFLMGVSHDLKTPLTSIEGYIEAISDGFADDPKKMKKYLSIIREKSHLLEERIVQLIDFVKIETGEWRLKNEDLNLAEFLRDVAGVYGEDAVIFGRSFSARIDVEPGFVVRGDRPLLFRAFENLIINAMQHTGESDAIVLEAYCDEKGAVINVRDTGGGIPGDDLDRIFDPFYRRSSSRREPGTGLGLSVVRSIFTSHGWSVEAASHPGEGTTFIIRIPHPESPQRG